MNIPIPKLYRAGFRDGYHDADMGDKHKDVSGPSWDIQYAAGYCAGFQEATERIKKAGPNEPIPEIE